MDVQQSGAVLQKVLAQVSFNKEDILSDQY